MNQKFVKGFRISLGFFLLALLIFLADIGRIVSRLAQTDLLIYSGAVMTFLTIYLWSALRWDSLITGLGYEMDLTESMKVIAMSYGFNKILPLNSGDLTRSKLMERYTDVDSHGKVLGAVAMERFMDVTLIGILTAISGLMILGSLEQFYWLIIAGFVAFSGMVGARVFADSFREILRKLEQHGLPERISSFVIDALAGYRDISGEKLAEASLWHGVRWIAGILVLYILALSAGTPISLAGATLATGLMSLVAALPITPGGIGPVEASGTGALILAGLSSSEAVALVVLQRSLGFLLMAVVGSLVYVRGQ